MRENEMNRNSFYEKKNHLTHSISLWYDNKNLEFIIIVENVNGWNALWVQHYADYYKSGKKKKNVTKQKRRAEHILYTMALELEVKCF